MVEAESIDNGGLVDITPCPYFLNSIRNQNLRWKEILGEFLDNAFDADARRVIVSWTKSHIVIEDDGVGCSDLLQLLRLGDHSRHATTSLGYYGVGFKDAAISAGDCVTVTSTHKKVQRMAACSWKTLERQKTWHIKRPDEIPVDAPSGTKIVLTQLRNKEGVKKDRLDAILSELSLQYTPAIRMGKQILFNGSPIPEYRFPELEHQMEKVIILDQDSPEPRHARVMMGVVPVGTPVRESGMIISCGFRVISRGERLGLGVTPTPGLCGWIELLTGWHLTKNKNNVSSRLDDLAKRINEDFRSIIDLASIRGLSLVLANVTSRINSLLNEITAPATSPRLADNGLPNAKAVRGSPANNTGTAQRKGTGRKHRQAARTQTGQTFYEQITSTAQGLQISFEHYGPDAPVAKVSGGVIYLNEDAPAIVQDRNNEHILIIHALYHAATYLVLTKQEPHLPFLGLLEDDVQKASGLFSYLYQRLLQASPAPAECA